MSQEPTISSSDVLSLFQPKILAAIDYIRNVNKQLPDAEAVYRYISRTKASNVNKTDTVNSTDESVKQNVVVNNNNNNKKNSSGYDLVFPYNNNLVSPIPQMEFASNSTTPIITPGETNSVTPNLTNSPETQNATLTGSNKNTNIETLSPCNCRSALLIIKSSKNNILKVEAQLSALKSYVNCELSILRNQLESFTEHTQMSLATRI